MATANTMYIYRLSKIVSHVFSKSLFPWVPFRPGGGGGQVAFRWVMVGTVGNKSMYACCHWYWTITNASIVDLLLLALQLNVNTNVFYVSAIFQCFTYRQYFSVYVSAIFQCFTTYRQYIGVLSIGNISVFYMYVSAIYQCFAYRQYFSVLHIGNVSVFYVSAIFQCCTSRQYFSVVRLGSISAV